MKDIINICVTTTNNDYIKFLATFIESLNDHINDRYIYKLFVLLDSQISSENKKKLEYNIRKNLLIQYITVDQNIFGGYKNIKNVVLCYRWIIDKYVSVDKILYLDLDTIIAGDISELYFTDLGNNVIGAAKDVVVWKLPILKEYGIKKYFNNGVQLINLKKWKGENIGQKILEFWDKNFSRLGIVDQDSQNIVLKDKRLCISPKWNGINISVFTSRGTQYTEKELYELRHPIIVHYAGWQHRPWGWLLCVHPKRYLYYKYIFRTKFWDIPDICKFPLRILTSNFVVRFLYKLARLLFHKG